MHELDDHIVLITGAGAGIGRALAIDAAARGARVFLVGRQSVSLAVTAMQIKSSLPVTIQADVTTAEGRFHIRQTLERTAGRLDILINNAGIIGFGPLSMATDQELEGMARTNLLAPACLTRDLLPLLERSLGPRIVNVGSMFGDVAFPLFAFYSATKFGLRGLSDALRRELAPRGIGVTYAAPRATRTSAAARFSHLEKPFGMSFDSPEDVARRILDGALAGRAHIYPAGFERLFMLLQGLLPRTFDKSIGRMLRRVPAAVPDLQLNEGRR